MPIMVDCDTSKWALAGFPGWDPICGSCWNNARVQYPEMIRGSKYAKGRKNLADALAQNKFFVGGVSCLSLPLLIVTHNPFRRAARYQCEACHSEFENVNAFCSHF